MAMGLIQGPIAPAFSQINRTWIPPGIEKVWAFRCIRSVVALPRFLDSLLGLFGSADRETGPRLSLSSWSPLDLSQRTCGHGLANPGHFAASLSHQLTPLLGAFITSRLAARGWRFACMCFAGAAAAFTIVWQLLGTSSPVPLDAPPSDSGAPVKAATKPKKAVE